GTRKQIIGFARFNTRAQALDARDMLSGKKVDAEKGNVLKAEMAKKNLHTKRGLSNELGVGPPGVGGGPSFPLSALDQQTLAPQGGWSTRPPPPPPSSSASAASRPYSRERLRNAFSRCPGFRRLSFRSKSNGPIVFVEFEDVMYATRALTEMYGNTLGGIVKGGIRLSYSK
ncbi:hypothetical protein BCR35DRAFT_254331, partial [Leucosporidium creatinivorum]